MPLSHDGAASGPKPLHDGAASGPKPLHDGAASGPKPLVESLLRETVAAGASDLFLSEGRSPAWRVDGAVTVTLHPPTTRNELTELLAAVLRPAQREAFERTGDIDIGQTLPELGRFRFHFHVQRGAVGAVVRAVPSGQVAFETLGLPPSLRALAQARSGLVLLAGSTGSGKSTSLAAMVHHINASSQKHIVTLEDPIEFVHDDLLSIVTQREIGSDVADFSAGLKNLLRQSPDVIVIGELRDAESMAVAMSAALTGHLVLASLHTTDSRQALQRILGYFPEHQREQVCLDLSLCLRGIAAQRLVPRAGDTGRVPAVEVLTATPGVRRLLLEQRIDELEDVMRRDPAMETFDRALVRLYHAGAITFETGAAHASHPDEFRLGARGVERVAQAAEAIESEDDESEVQPLLAAATKRAASDLHLIADSPPLLRIHGRLVPLEGKAPLSAGAVRRLLGSLFTHAQRERFDLEHELDFALTTPGGHRFRINAHMQRGTPAVAIRLIPPELPDASKLGLPKVLQTLSEKSQGLVLVTGPTGAGKSTTLASMIDMINRERSCHIITIEDPIEFFHPNRLAIVEQRELGEDTKSFAAALKHILRQDPDVILVGELRDVETIAAALTAAETGHLVLATLHANDAPQTVDRLVDVFPAAQQPQIRVQLASELLAILAQRLLTRVDGKGRVAAFEVMVATSAVRRLIRDGKGHQLGSAMETGGKDGMVTLDRAISDLVEARSVTPEEAARYMRNPATLKTE
jgi:pilus retraction protein PilT